MRKVLFNLTRISLLIAVTSLFVFSLYCPKIVSAEVRQSGNHYYTDLNGITRKRNIIYTGETCMGVMLFHKEATEEYFGYSIAESKMIWKSEIPFDKVQTGWRVFAGVSKFIIIRTRDPKSLRYAMFDPKTGEASWIYTVKLEHPIVENGEIRVHPYNGTDKLTIIDYHNYTLRFVDFCCEAIHNATCYRDFAYLSIFDRLYFVREVRLMQALPPCFSRKGRRGICEVEGYEITAVSSSGRYIYIMYRKLQSKHDPSSKQVRLIAIYTLGFTYLCKYEFEQERDMHFAGIWSDKHNALWFRCRKSNPDKNEDECEFLKFEAAIHEFELESHKVNLYSDDYFFVNGENCISASSNGENIICYSLAKREVVWKLDGIRMTSPLSSSKCYTFPNLTLLGSFAFSKDKATLDAMTSFLEAN